MAGKAAGDQLDKREKNEKAKKKKSVKRILPQVTHISKGFFLV